MAIHEYALFSVYCFLMGLSSSLSLLFISSGIHMACLVPGFVFIDFLYLKFFLRGEKFKVGVRSNLMGLTFSIGIMIIVLCPDEVKVFGFYTCILAFFHFSEFLAIAITNPSTLSVRSFVLDNGWEYRTAAVCSSLEFFIESYFCPWLKIIWPISSIGLIMCILGEILRKVAMWTASTNFNHEVQSVHAEGHILVTNGVYHYMRHPSYVGWFIWSVGSQVLLINPVCMIGYAIVSWWFFHQRIYYEEVILLNFFGEDYHRYQQSTGTGLPFIKGFLLDES